MWTIRCATLADRSMLQDIERRAGEQFRDVGLGEIADDDPFSIDELAAYVDAERSWVAADDADRPIGYVVVDLVDGNTHVEQVSVLPEHQGRGVGRALMDWVDDWAKARDHEWVTLTTFVDVPWNAPLYRHLGFDVIAEPDIGPGLLAVRAVETAHGLDPATRVCMRKRVGP